MRACLKYIITLLFVLLIYFVPCTISLVINMYVILLFCIIGVIIAVIKLYLLYKSKYNQDFS